MAFILDTCEPKYTSRFRFTPQQNSSKTMCFCVYSTLYLPLLTYLHKPKKNGEQSLINMATYHRTQGGQSISNNGLPQQNLQQWLVFACARASRCVYFRQFWNPMRKWSIFLSAVLRWCGRRGASCLLLGSSGISWSLFACLANVAIPGFSGM